MLIDNLELQARRMDKKAKREAEIYNQRLAEIAKKCPSLFSNPTALELMLMAERQRRAMEEGMA